MIRAIAVDDEPLALEVIKTYCEGIDFITLEKTFTQTSEARKYLESFPVDLLFLDINMPSVSGIDFYKSVKQNTMVIFSTAHAQYAVDGFELSAVDFLLKPYSLERFTTAVTKAKEYYNFLHHKQAADQHIFVRSEYNLIKIQLTDIYFIEGLADYLKLHLTNGKVILTRMTMKAVLSRLPENEFMRIHRSYIVPTKKIMAVRNKHVILQGEKEIPIGISYEQDFTRAFGDL